MRQLADANPADLAARLGPTMGPWYRQLARGVDPSRVDGSLYVPRGRSRETTFQQNLTDTAEIEREVRRLAGQVTGDLRADGRPAVRVTVKMRFAPFFTQTRSRTLPAPTGDADLIGAVALELARSFEAGRPVRLVGVRAEMTEPTD